METTKNYQRISQLVQAIKNCQQHGNTEWQDRHEQELAKILDSAPSGSGFDAGTELDADASNSKELVFHTAYHHMTEAGYYNGWTEHTVKVKADLCFGFYLHITGKNRNDIKDYIGEVFHCWLTED